MRPGPHRAGLSGAARGRPLAGVSLLVIGAGHLVLGAVRYRRPLVDMVREGYVASLTRAELSPAASLERQRAFWFEVSGVGLVLLGVQTALLERQGVRPPQQTGWALGALAVAGGAALPTSGFWALLLPAWLTVAERRQGGAGPPGRR